jgi:GntR family transcriptional regulator
MGGGSRAKGFAAIAARLRERILAGRVPSGSQLSAERVLAGEYGVSRVTIRRALRLLEDERLVRRRHGSGTYVSPQPTRRIPVMIDYTGSMRAHAPKLTRTLLVRDWRRAETAAGDLGVDPDADVLYVERVDRIRGRPVAWDRGYIAAAFARNLTEALLARVDFIEAWSAAAGFAVHSCRQTVEAVRADARAVARLGLGRSDPVLKSTEVYRADPRRAAGLFESFYHPGRLCVQSHFHWRPARARTERTGNSRHGNTPGSKIGAKP